MWECYCFSSQASMMSTSLNTPFQGFWNSCENVPGTNSCMTFLSRPDLLYVLSSNICGKQINASGMYGREWTLFRGKQCHRDTAALSAPTCPAYLCSSSLGFKCSWTRPQNSGNFFNEKWGGHHSHISQKSCFPSVLDFSVTMCALPSIFILLPHQTKCRPVWQSLPEPTMLGPLAFTCSFLWRERERWKSPQDHHEEMSIALSHFHFHWQGRTCRFLE